MKTGALEFLEDRRVLDIVLLLREVCLLGREFGDILLCDEEASAEHCQIQRFGDTYHILDLNSTNGTFLNGRRILKGKLAQGDVLAIGKLRLRFVLVDLASAPDPLELLEAMRAAHPVPEGRAGELIAAIVTARRECLSKAHLILDVIYGDGGQEVLKFSDGKAQLGRGSTRGKFNADRELSKRHASISLDRGLLKLQDHDSTNGTFVNEKRIGQSAVVVSPCDMIRIGRTRIWCKPDISVS